MSRRWIVVAPLLAGVALTAATCGGPTPSGRYALHQYRSWLQAQPGVESVDAKLVPESCDSCMLGQPYTGSVTVHMRSGITPTRLLALSQALRSRHDDIVAYQPAIPVVVDGLTVPLGASSVSGGPDTAAIERDDIALLDAVRRMHLPGVTGRIEGDAITLRTADDRLLPIATSVAAPDSPVTTTAAATRAAGTAGTGHPAVPPGTVFLDVVSAQSERATMTFLVGSGKLAADSRSGLVTLEALGGTFPRALFTTDTRSDVITLDERGPVTAQQWSTAVATVAAHLPRGTVQATVRRADPDPIGLSVPLSTVPAGAAADIPTLAAAVPADVVVSDISSDGTALTATLHTRGAAVPTPAQEKRILAAARTWPLSRIVARYAVVATPQQTDPAHPPTPTTSPPSTTALGVSSPVTSMAAPRP